MRAHALTNAQTEEQTLTSLSFLPAHDTLKRDLVSVTQRAQSGVSQYTVDVIYGECSVIELRVVQSSSPPFDFLILSSFLLLTISARFIVCSL